MNSVQFFSLMLGQQNEKYAFIPLPRADFFRI